MSSVHKGAERGPESLSYSKDRKHGIWDSSSCTIYLPLVQKKDDGTGLEIPTRKQTRFQLYLSVVDPLMNVFLRYRLPARKQGSKTEQNRKMIVCSLLSQCGETR